MSDTEKLIEMVSDVSRLRGMYDALLAERDALKAELENCILNLAGCSTFAMGYGIDEPPPDLKPTRVALGDVLRLAYRERDARKDCDRWRTLAEGARASLETIRDKDYRGNRCSCYNDAKQALRAFEEGK